jgi:hypothetical protein
MVFLCHAKAATAPNAIIISPIAATKAANTARMSGNILPPSRRPPVGFEAVRNIAAAFAPASSLTKIHHEWTVNI